MKQLFLLAATAALLLAQADNWTLLKGVNPGQDTHVHLLDGKRHTGGFISVTDTEVVIRQRTGDQAFPKDRIKKISVRKGVKRWRNAAIGAGIAAAAVGTALGVVYAASDGHGSDYSLIAAGISAYAVIGAGVGALFPGYDTIYRAP